MPEPKHGEVLVKVAYLSLDPYQRGRMREACRLCGQCRAGRGDDRWRGGRGRQVQHAALQGGRHRRGEPGLAEYAIGGGLRMRKVDPSLAPISTANGVLGMPGMTAYFGLLECGQPKPGETIVVSAASGAVGQIVGQIGKLMGCRVVGIAGGAKKCAFVKDELGFDACLDYKAEKDLDAGRQSPPAPTGPTSISTMSAARSPIQSCATSTFMAAWPSVASISQYNATSPPMGPAPARYLRGQARHAARLHRVRFRRTLSHGDAPDGRMDQGGARSSIARTWSRASTRRRVPSSACCAARISARCS